jgi:mono/diheme cytochrome c family protein
MRPQSVIFLLLLLVVGLGFGCSDEGGFDPNESETSKAIREKVRARMEIERLQRLAPRVAYANQSAAAADTATMDVAAIAAAGGGSDSGGSGASPGASLYAQNCSSCHGPRGAGDGPVGATLNPQPARHDDGEYMNALSNEHLFMVIQEGGAAVGKSPTMAAWGATMSDDQIREVIVFVRSLAEPPYEGPLP